MREVGAAAMPIIPTFDGIKANLEKGVTGPLGRAGTESGRRFGDNAGRSLTSSLSRHTKRAALLAAGTFAGAGIAAIKYGSDAVGLAADLEQSVGAVDTVFKKSSDQIHGWAKTAATDVGLTRNEFNELGSLIGTQLRNGGTAMTRLAPKTKKLITLGADLSSMFGGDTREAVEALSSALKGERDPIERYGVSINEAAIKAEALSAGIVKAKVSSFDLKQATLKMGIAQANFNKQVKEHGRDSIEAAKAEATLGAATKKFNEVSAGKVDELTAQQKQQATLALIYKQTADAQGNFGKESDTLAHKQQVLRSSMENIKTEIGTALLPAMSDAADFLLEKGVPAFQDFSDWFGDKGVPAIQDFAREIRPLAEELVPAVGSALGVVADALKTAAPLAKDMVGAFNDMPDWAKAGFVLGGVGLGVKSKLNKGKAGLLGGSTGSSATDPAYVVVVNGGAGTSGGGGKGGKGGGFLGFNPASFAAIATALSIQDTISRKNEGDKAVRDRDAAQALLEKRIRDGKDPFYYLTGGANRQGAVEFFDKLATGETQISKLSKVAGAWGKALDLTSDDIANLRKAAGTAATSLGHLPPLVDGMRAGDKPGSAFQNSFAPPKAPKPGDKKDTVEANFNLLLTDGAKKTKGDVGKLLEDVDQLDRRNYDLMFNSLGLTKAKNDAQTLLNLLQQIARNTPSNIGGPSGLNPFDGPRSGRTIDRRGAGGLSIDRLIVQGTTSRQLTADLQATARRAAIGGF